MIELIFTFQLCTGFQFINLTKNKKYTKLDRETVARASEVCTNRYKSCLKTIVKHKERSYQAICK